TLEWATAPSRGEDRLGDLLDRNPGPGNARRDPLRRLADTGRRRERHVRPLQAAASGDPEMPGPRLVAGERPAVHADAPLAPPGDEEGPEPDEDRGCAGWPCPPARAARPRLRA